MSDKFDKETEALLRWIAERVHQGYHTDHPGNWQECPKGICQAVHDYLSAHSYEQQVADVLMERPQSKRDREKLLHGVKVLQERLDSKARELHRELRELEAPGLQRGLDL